MPFSSTVPDAASRIAFIEIFVNLTMLIKAEYSLFVNRELMRVSAACGWVLLRKFLTIFHFMLRTLVMNPIIFFALCKFIR
jgi:hypothetical protein